MNLFCQPLRPINRGLESLYESMIAQGMDAIAVDWQTGRCRWTAVPS
jgi:hypothetical protein